VGEKWSAFHVDCGTLNWLQLLTRSQMVLLYKPRALPGCDDTPHGRVFFCGWLAKRSAAIDHGHALSFGF
jgi:hypothetical protein